MEESDEVRRRTSLSADQDFAGAAIYASSTLRGAAKSQWTRK